MPSGKPELIRRHEAVDKVARKYRGRPCDFREADCVRMVRTLLVAMGHRGLPQLPRYSTAAGAARALKKAGFDNIEALFDSLLVRIPPATMRDGDIVVAPSADGLGSAFIKVGHKIMGWREDAAECVMIVPNPELSMPAWKALP